MAKPQLGTKRTCAECEAKFYDLQKDPIICPKCGATYQPAKLTRAERAAATTVKPSEEEADTALPEDDAVLVSLEDAEAEQASTGAKGKSLDVDGDDIDDDIEDTADDDDDTFLEEDDEDPDVSDLIDGDIEPEEES